MRLEQFIIKKAEKRLLSYRTQAESVKREKAVGYQQHLPQISRLYKRATHWHGTGRYHYQHQKDSRYEEVCEDKVIDILDAILESDGLKPHVDPWIDSGGKTVSLATVRMHAKAFARIHTYERDILLYELGSIKYWLRLYFLLLLIWFGSNFRTHLTLIRTLFRPSFFQDIQSWSSAIRKPNKKKVVSILNIFRGDVPVSDIAGNYPILIGIVIESENLIDTIPLTNKVEKRSLKLIKLSQFTHIEVPLQKIAETKKILEKRGISLPIVPLEFGDLYLANQPLETLAYS